MSTLDLDAFKNSFQQDTPPDDLTPDALDINAFKDSLQGDRETALEHSLEVSVDTNPEARARAAVIAEEESLPIDMVEADQSIFERRKRMRTGLDAVRDTPLTADFLRNPDNAKVAHDDAANLAAFEKTFDSFKASDVLFRAPGGELISTPGRMLRGLGVLNDAIGRSITRGIRSVGLDSVADALQAPVIPHYLNPSHSVQYAGASIVDIGKSVGVPKERQNLATDITGGVGQISAQILLGVFGAPAQVAGLFGQGADVMNEKALQKKSDDPEYQAKVDAALLSGSAVTALTEKMGLDALLNRVPPKIKNDVMRFFADKFIAGGIEAAQEVVEGVTHNLIASLTFNPDQNLTEGLDREAIAAGGAGALFRTLIGAGRSASGLVQESIKAERAQQNLEVFQAMGENAAASKVRERLPSKYREFVEAVKAQHGTVENVYVDPEAVVELMQSGNIDVRKEGFTDLPEKVRLAQETSQPVEIPLEDYQAYIAGTDAGQALMGDIKFAADDFTANEAANFNDEVQAVFETEYEEALRQDRDNRAAQGPFDRIFDNVRDQLIASGQSPDNAEQQAALHRAHARVLQTRYGVDPETLYGDLSIKGPIPESLRAPTEPLDLIIDRARSGVVQNDKVLFGESLQDFARKMGIKDDRGDLEGQDVDRDLKPFQRKMLREDGAALDDLLEAAVQAGYFPETGGDRAALDLATFIDALTGDALFVEGAGDQNEVLRNEAAEALIETLHRLDVDIDSSNEEIKAALQAAESVDGGRVLEQAERSIKSVLQAANADGNPSVSEEIGEVSGWLSGLAKEAAGLDIVGFAHSIDAFSIRHIRKQHGNPKTETSRGQIALNDDDFLSIPEILSAPDKVVFGVNTRIGRDAIGYLKKMPDGTIFYLEEVRNGRGVLAATSMRKYPATTRADSITASLVSTPGNDGGDAVNIVDVPKNASAIELEQTNRGSIQFFPDGQTVINLGKSADLSTFLHESGHFFVNTLATIADSNELAQNDLAAMMKFAGVETVQGFNEVEAQEKLARGFEAYLREGTAPSVELQSAFSRFRSWLINIYRSLRGLDVEIDDSIRGVFDRLLATDEQIAEAEQVNNFKIEPAVADMMNDAERTAYENAARIATDQAAFQLEKQKIAEMTREETARWKDEFDTVRAEISEAMDNLPVYRAIDAIRDRDNGLYLSRDAVDDIIGIEGRKRLPGGLTRIEGGVHPDLVADQSGFSSADEMLFAMMDAAKNKTERAELVKGLADDQMKELHGSLNDNTADAAEAASEIVHNDERGRFLAMELRAISRGTNTQPTPASVAKATAKRIIATLKSKDAIQTGKYASAEVKAATDATRALLKGDIEAAQEAKRRQLLNHYLFMESRKARDEIDGMVRYFNKFKKRSKSIDADYAEQIEGLLERYDFRRNISGREIERRKSLAAFVDEQNEDKQPVSIDERLLDEARLQHYKDTSLEELRGMKDAVKHLEHLGRLKSKLTANKEKRDLDDTVDLLADSIEGNWKGKYRGRTASLTPLQRSSEWFQSKASLRRVEFLMRELDGFKPGPMQEILFQTVAVADDNLQERRFEAGAAIRDLFQPFKWRDVKQFFSKKTFIPEIGDSLTHESVLAVALNVGNTDNREKLLKGYGWDEAALDAVLAKMSKRDWDLVQGIWDYLDTFWEETVALDKETKGYAAPKIEAEAVETPFGTYRGGYYRIKYDSRGSKERALINNTEDIYNRMIMGDIGRPTTNQGRTKERMAPVDGLKIRLDLGVFFEAVEETVHDLSFRKAAIDTSKIINHPRFVDALNNTVGEPRVDMLRDWLKDSVAGDASPVSSPADKAFAHIRKRTTIMAMGYKLSTALIQPLGYTQTVSRFIQDAGMKAGLKYSARGIRKFYGAPKQGVRFVNEQSSFMRQRALTYDRDVHAAVKNLKKGPLSYYEESFFWHIAKMQQAVDYPTWMGAYEWSMDNQPEKGEEAAARYADSVVRMSQGSGSAKDLAAIQKGGEGVRMFNMFMTYFSAMNNMIIDEARMLKRNPSPGQIAQFSTNMFLLTVVPSVLVNALYGAAGVDGPDDDDSWGGWLFKSWVMQLLGGLPVIRDIASTAVGGFPFEISPVAASVKKAINVTKQIQQGEMDRALANSALTAAALVAPVPIPTGQIMITGDYFIDWFAGEKEGFNPIEAFVKRDHRKN